MDVFALVRESEPVHHREAAHLAERAFSVGLASWPVLSAQWYWLRRRPRAYASAWWGAVRGNARSPRFLMRALAVVPLAATFARRMRAARVEHIHAHWATHPTLAAYVASRLTGIPYSFTGHAHDIYVDRTMLQEKIAGASFVVTISEFNRRLLERLYGSRGARPGRRHPLRNGSAPLRAAGRPARRPVDDRLRREPATAEGPAIPHRGVSPPHCRRSRSAMSSRRRRRNASRSGAAGSRLPVWKTESCSSGSSLVIESSRSSALPTRSHSRASSLRAGRWRASPSH